MVYRLIVVLVFGCMIGVCLQAASGDGCSNDDRSVAQTEALMKAVSDGKLEEVQSLLDSKVDVHRRDKKEDTALMVAIELGRVEILKLLLANGAKDGIGMADENGNTPLMIAASHESDDVAIKFIQELLDAGARLTDKNNDGCNALMLAVEYNNGKAVRALLTAAKQFFGVVGTEEHLGLQQDSEGQTALMKAIFLGNKEILKLLLENGAKKHINIKNLLGVTALMKAILLGNKETVEVLVDAGAKTGPELSDPELIAASQPPVPVVKPQTLTSEAYYDEDNKSFEEGNGVETLLDLARSGGNEAVRRLFGDIYKEKNRARDKGNKEDEWSLIESWVAEHGKDVWDTALMTAAKTGNKEAAQELLKVGAMIDAQNGECGYTPLLTAIENEQWEFVLFLLNKKANVNKPDEDGTTPLMHLFVSFDDSVTIAIIQALLDAGAFVDAQNKNGYTALMIVAGHGRDAAKIQILLNARANKDLKNKKGRTALMFAEAATEYGNKQAIVNLLKGEDKAPAELVDVAPKSQHQRPAPPAEQRQSAPKALVANPNSLSSWSPLSSTVAVSVAFSVLLAVGVYIFRDKIGLKRA